MSDEPSTGGSFRQLREYARGELDVGHEDVLPVAGVVRDERARAILGRMAEMYEPASAEMPRSFWDTEIAERAIRRYATDAASDAIERGNQTLAEYLVGEPSYKSDVSGIHAINQLADWLTTSEATKLVYIAALMGRGKTDFSLLLLEVAHDHFRRLDRHLDERVETPEFAANFWVETPPDVDATVKHIDNYRDLIEWGRRGDSDMTRWFVFDEASTELTAQSGKNAQDVAEMFAPFVKKMRKMGINMIIIGHDKGDVHVAIRSLADFVDKSGKKKARFYAGINSREPQGHLFSVEGIPPTSWGFDTDDTAEWSWGDAALDPGMSDKQFKREIAERGARVWLATPSEVRQSDIAEAISTEEVSVNQSDISRAKRRIKEEEQSDTEAIA